MRELQLLESTVSKMVQLVNVEHNSKLESQSFVVYCADSNLMPKIGVHVCALRKYSGLGRMWRFSGPWIISSFHMAYS